MSATVDDDKNVDVDDYFLLAARVWNNKSQNYSAIDDSDTIQKYFNNYQDAEESFQSSDTFSDLKEKDIKLDLIHVRFSVNRFLLSRIVI
jgi:hypothetical protein